MAHSVATLPATVGLQVQTPIVYRRCNPYSQGVDMCFTVTGSGCYLPEYSITADELDAKLGLAPGSCAGRYCVEKRHYAAKHESALYMGSRAARNALDSAGLSLSDIDLLICASGTNHQALPYNAAGIVREIGQQCEIASMDVNSSCLSFLSALEVSQGLLAAGRYRRILIVSSEVASVGIENGNPEVASMFGDGSAAIILQAKRNAKGLFSSLFRTYPQGYPFCQIRAGGSNLHPAHSDETQYSDGAYFEMRGRELYRLVAELSPAFINEGLQNAGLLKSDIDYVVPHQASGLGLQHLTKRLGFPKDKVVNIFARAGNQIAASLPMALHELLSTRTDLKGKKLMLMGSGAGLTLGFGVLGL
jgi:3-oxoacyl-[acyl-carrier-protein] synthase-3